MANTTFSRNHGEISSSIHSLAWEEIRKAGEEERKLALESGDVDDDGVPFCTVVADGQWSKRSYKTKYDALSGVVNYIIEQNCIIIINYIIYILYSRRRFQYQFISKL